VNHRRAAHAPDTVGIAVHAVVVAVKRPPARILGHQ
jgi:hypothetical protein